MKKVLRMTKWLTLITGILIAVLGFSMLFTPLENLVTLAIFIAIGMLFSGISEIIDFCSEEKGRRSGWLLASGIISTVFGIWAMFGSGTEALISILPFIFAVWVLTSSVMRIVGAVQCKKEGFSQWGWMMTLGILGAILGFVLLFSPILSSMIVSYTMAIMFISYGVNNIIIFFRMKKVGDEIRKFLDK